MNCAICKHGETVAGMTTVVLQRGETTVIIKGMPRRRSISADRLLRDAARRPYQSDAGGRSI